VSDVERDRAERLLRENIVISLHDHPVQFPDDMRETPQYNRTGRQHTAFAGLMASGMTIVFDNMMDGTACVTGNAPWRWLDIITDLGMRQADLAHQDDDRRDSHAERHREREARRQGGSRLRSRGRDAQSRMSSIDSTCSLVSVFARSALPTRTRTRSAVG
jgi:hypothetical protein